MSSGMILYTGGAVLLATGLLFAAAYLLSHRRDARLLRNGVFLTAAIAFGSVGILCLAANVFPPAGLLLLLLAVLVPISVLALTIAVIWNGVIMWRREGRSLANRLSLLVGILILLLPILSVIASSWFGEVGFLLSLLVVLVTADAAIAFVSFAIYSVVYGRMRHTSPPTGIVIHGVGLRPDGTVAEEPLLDREVRFVADSAVAVADPGIGVDAFWGGVGTDLVEDRPCFGPDGGFSGHCQLAPLVGTSWQRALSARAAAPLR